jgi:hypothetical protein
MDTRKPIFVSLFKLLLTLAATNVGVMWAFGWGSGGMVLSLVLAVTTTVVRASTKGVTVGRYCSLFGW